MMTSDERELIGEVWRRHALGEHASVAAFARFVLHLMKLAAPPELVLAAIRAMEDEVLHARLCFGIASRLTGQSVGPGELDLANVLDGGDDIVSILQGAVVEGCVNETISARYAAVAADRTEDPEIRRVLERIAQDEQRHADLAWRFLEWMLGKYPDLTATAEASFTSASQVSAVATPDEPVLLERYGQLVASSRAVVRAQVLHDTIEPRRASLVRARVPAMD